MPQQPLDYLSLPSREPTTYGRWLFTIIALGLIAASNLLMLALAWSDRSWGALFIAFYANPFINGAIAIVSLAMTPAAWRRSGSAGGLVHLAASVAVPL